MVDTISKYRIPLPPTLPTFFIFPAPVIPNTTVKNMIGAMTIFIKLINKSLIIFPV